MAAVPVGALLPQLVRCVATAELACPARSGPYTSLLLMAELCIPFVQAPRMPQTWSVPWPTC